MGEVILIFVAQTGPNMTLPVDHGIFAQFPPSSHAGHRQPRTPPHPTALPLPLSAMRAAECSG